MRKKIKKIILISKYPGKINKTMRPKSESTGGHWLTPLTRSNSVNSNSSLNRTYQFTTFPMGRLK